MALIKITPLKGRKPKDPKTRRDLPESGITVHKVSTYWKNRFKDGDIAIDGKSINDKAKKGK